MKLVRKLEWETSVCVLQVTLEVLPSTAQVARASTQKDWVGDLCASQHTKPEDMAESCAGELKIGDLPGGCH